MVTAERQLELRRTLRYLRALRVLVQRAAAEHAAWARFVGGASAVLRAEPGMSHSTQADVAVRYERAFAARRGQLSALAPAPARCATAHEAAADWLESLERLAGGAAAAIAKSAGGELDVVVRAAGEPGRRLKRFQRTHARTIASIGATVGGLPPARASSVDGKAVPMRGPRLPAKSSSAAS